MPVPHRSTESSRPRHRRAPDTLVDFHTGTTRSSTPCRTRRPRTSRRTAPTTSSPSRPRRPWTPRAPFAVERSLTSPLGTVAAVPPSTLTNVHKTLLSDQTATPSGATRAHIDACAGVATRTHDELDLDARPGWRRRRRRMPRPQAAPGALPQRAHGTLEAEELDEKADDVPRNGDDVAGSRRRADLVRIA